MHVCRIYIKKQLKPNNRKWDMYSQHMILIIWPYKIIYIIVIHIFKVTTSINLYCQHCIYTLIKTYTYIYNILHTISHIYIYITTLKKTKRVTATFLEVSWVVRWATLIWVSNPVLWVSQPVLWVSQPFHECQTDTPEKSLRRLLHIFQKIRLNIS